MTYIKWFDQIRLTDIPLVGGKNASIGEMYGSLRAKGINVPYGFAITTAAYRDFLNDNNLTEKIRTFLSMIHLNEPRSLQEQGHKIRNLILTSAFPKSLEGEITEAYETLTQDQPLKDVAVRSSATSEDLEDISFAGQQETYLNIQGEEELIKSCKKCMASLYTDRAISYRIHQNYTDADIALSIGVQNMVRSDLATSGVMFTIDTESGFRDAIVINAAYGLGENLVQGSVNPDEYYVFKPTLREGFSPIIQKKVGSKSSKMIYENKGSKQVTSVPVDKKDREKVALPEDEILQLARWGILIEEHYSDLKQQHTPMDIEWAKDGLSNEIYIVQTRPETVHSQRKFIEIERYHISPPRPPLLKGIAIGEKVATGKVRVIDKIDDIPSLQDGEILVAAMTDPDWEPAMKKAAAIVSDRGGRTCHAAIVSRELGLPAVIGTKQGTAVLRTGQEITVSCAQGSEGYIYEGILPFERETKTLATIPTTKTKLMMNIANPDEAFRLSFYPNGGVGLARLEFIINNTIGIHPLALIHFEELKDTALKHQIEEKTSSYPNKVQYFIDKLAEGIAMIAAAFYPKDVIVRMSDFKTDEYANLIGGHLFETVEANPMIGFRGACRYYSESYREGFALECAALKKARDRMGLLNIKAMIPFCRTLEEAEHVILEMKQNGLKQKENNFEIYMMAEVPSNFILADQFAQVFDGFSIGSNDLTQLILGVDRNSATMASLFDEQNPAVKRAISHIIKTAKEQDIKVGICGQGPSDCPQFAEFLVTQGIDSMSLTADRIIQTAFLVDDVEKKLKKSSPTEKKVVS